jgi:hypothetical protein
MRTTRAFSVLVAALSLAGTARAQSTRHAAPQLLPTQVISAPAPDDDPFQLDDALLHGIALTDAQRVDAAELRKLQVAEQDAARPRFMDAVGAMRRAHQRGDDATAGAIMAVLQSDMASQRTWRLAALRALLSAEQRQQFDANLDALLADRDGDGGPR